MSNPVPDQLETINKLLTEAIDDERLIPEIADLVNNLVIGCTTGRDLHVNCDADITRLGRENDVLKEQVHRLQTTLAAMSADITRPDGKQRMTSAQMRTLWIACGNYNVPFREDDYLLHKTDASFTPGYAEGWVGGNLHAAGNPHATIYLGVDPEGRSNS